MDNCCERSRVSVNAVFHVSTAAADWAVDGAKFLDNLSGLKLTYKEADGYGVSRCSRHAVEGGRAIKSRRVNNRRSVAQRSKAGGLATKSR